MEHVLASKLFSFVYITETNTALNLLAFLSLNIFQFLKFVNELSPFVERM